MANVTEVTLIEQVKDRLASEFANVSSDDVRIAVERAYARFEARPIRDFVPLFVERNARTELSRLVTTAAS